MMSAKKKKRRAPKAASLASSVTRGALDPVEWRVIALIAVVLACGFFALYLSLAARDLMFGDGPELTMAAILDGVAHPPGYPLWIMLGHIASLFPIGSLPFRVNATACAYHALTVGIVYVSGFVLTRRHIAAAFAALVLAVGSPLFVSWSLQAEVFSLNDLFAAAIVLVCLLWFDDPNRWRLVVPLAALFGFGVSNHQSLILLAPLPIFAAWCGRREIMKTGHSWTVFALAAVVLLLTFALPYVHTLAVSQHFASQFGAARTPRELLDLILRRAYGTTSLVSKSHQGGMLFDRITALVSAAGWPYAVILFGLIALAIRKRFRELGVAALILAGPLLAFCAVADVNVVDAPLARAIFQRFGLLPVTALAPFAACALAALEERVRPGWARSGVCVAMICAVLAAGILQMGELTLVGARGARTLFNDISNALPAHAVIFAKGDAVESSAEYFQSVEQWRPDVVVILFGHLGSPTYDAALRRDINIPPEAYLNVPPLVRRDIVVDANPRRTFYTVGDIDLDGPGPRYHALISGVVTHLVAYGQAIDPRGHLRDEVALETAPDYAGVGADVWQTNGFGELVRTWYAAGFLNTGLDAEQSGDRAAAQRWIALGRAYSSNPFVARAVEILHAEH